MDQKQVVAKFDAWISGLWFRPNALKAIARVDRVKGIYVPHWTFDAVTHSFWEAEAGYHYDEEETYTDAQGNQQTRQVRKTRWQTTHGYHRACFDDVLVPATTTVDNTLMNAVYPYRTEALVAYDPRYLVGWAAENYSKEMPECWPRARRFMDNQIHAACKRKVPGDTHRNLKVRSSYHNQTYKLCLLPVWLTSYRYGERVYTCLINGQTGEVQGHAPYSWVKILATLALVIAVFALVAACFMLL